MSRVEDLQQAWLQDPAYAFDFASLRKAAERPAAGAATSRGVVPPAPARAKRASKLAAAAGSRRS